MKRQPGRLFTAWRNFLGLNPKVPANDGATALFLWLLVLESVILFTTAFVAAHSDTIRPEALAVLQWFFLISNGFYGAYSAIYYPNKITIEAEIREQHVGQRNFEGLWRVGEHIGGAFIIIEGFVFALLAAFHVPLPFIGKIVRVPEEAFATAQIGVEMLVIFSTVKLFRSPTRRRRTHNNVLFSLCVVGSIVLAILIVNRTFGNAPVPKGLGDLYGITLIAYAAHNAIFSLLVPTEEQRRPGHIVGLCFGLAMIGIVALWAFHLVPQLPERIIYYFGVTVAIFFAGTAFRYFFKAPAEKILEKKRRNGKETPSP